MNKTDALQIGQRLVSAWNDHDLDAIVALHDREFSGIDIGEAAPREGRDAVRRAAGDYLRAFPDLHLRLDDAIADGDQLVLVWTARGTHAGAVMNIPPTQRELHVRGVCVLTLADGRIRRGLHLWDVAGMLRGIGLLPELPATSSGSPAASKLVG